MQSFLAKLGADAGLLHATERRVRLDGAVFVDPGGTAFETASEVTGFLTGMSPIMGSKRGSAIWKRS